MQRFPPLFPEQASSVAPEVDRLYGFLIGVSAFFATGICIVLVVFAARYHRSRAGSRGKLLHGSVPLELVWTFVPLGLTMVMFAWGASLYYRQSRTPADAVSFSATAKQWMWKFQHPSGHREVNELHVPVGETIELTMISEDVIHSFYVPAFRVKQDVLPGRYTRTWFQPTRVGSYHLFCAEYCGAKHSQMIGTVHVLEPHDYEAWLAGSVAGETALETGERLFTELRCDTCHAPGAEQRGPLLDGRFGTEVPLASGGTAVFDEAYVRESILRPKARVVQGYEPLMPSYEGQVTEDDVLALTALLRSLGADEEQR